MESQSEKLAMGLVVLAFFVLGVNAWTGEIHGRVVCDICGDSSIGPEDHVLEGLHLSQFLLNKLLNCRNFLLLDKFFIGFFPLCPIFIFIVICCSLIITLSVSMNAHLGFEFAGRCNWVRFRQQL